MQVSCGDGKHAPPESAWRDPSPHRVGYLSINGTRLQYLDWGGQGPPLVLIHGWGSNAHTFDDLAPRLVERHRVVGLTLGGFGQSDSVPSTYSLDRYADDLVGAFDSLGIQSATVVAHSFGGWVLTQAALRYPARITRAVYLDAAFDMRASDSVVARRPIQRPPLGPVTSAEQVKRWLETNFFGMWSPALEAEYRSRPLDEPVRAQQLRRVVDEAKAASTDWSRLPMPALAICALAEVESEFPWLRPADSLFRTAQRYIDTERRPFQHRECERFRRSGATHRTVELPGHHYIFIWHPDEVAAAIREFTAVR
jgi:pimeloyl-ACP methyl ester carboxylesterase